jgi:hypothetical protein
MSLQGLTEARNLLPEWLAIASKPQVSKVGAVAEHLEKMAKGWVPQLLGVPFYFDMSTFLSVNRTMVTQSVAHICGCIATHSVYVHDVTLLKESVYAGSAGLLAIEPAARSLLGIEDGVAAHLFRGANHPDSGGPGVHSVRVHDAARTMRHLDATGEVHFTY